jgi:hypothetical protein
MEKYSLLLLRLPIHRKSTENNYLTMDFLLIIGDRLKNVVVDTLTSIGEYIQ